MNTLPEDTRAKLHQAGIKSVVDFVRCAAGRIASKAGIPYKEVVEIRRRLLHECACIPVAASNLWETTNHVLLPTGSHNLDLLLDGGLLTGQLTEICGGPGAGKTQLCHCMASYISMATGSTVAYVDSSGSFDAHLIREVLKSKCLREEDIDLASSKIRVFQLFSIFELLLLLNSFKEGIPRMDNPFLANLRLVVIDSVTPLISPLLGGRHSHGHVIMCQLVRAMRELASEQSIALLYTNNMVSNVGEGRCGLKPALGLTWSHTPSTRLTLSTSLTPSTTLTTDSTRVATLTKSQQLATGVSTTFTISSHGLTDQ